MLARKIVLAIVILVAIFVLSMTVYAAETVGLGQNEFGQYNAVGTQVLHGHVPAVVSQLQPVSSLSGSEHLHLAIGLPLRNQTMLTELLQRIYNPASPDYHHYLTPEQFTEMFGPTEKDYQAVVTFAKKHGLTVTGTHSNRMLLDVDGSVADTEKAMHVKMHIYNHPKEARTFYAPDTEPSLDITVPVLHISGLDNYSLPHPRMTATPLTNLKNVVPNTGSGPSGYYMGNDFRAAYVPDSSLTGSGQVVGLLQFDGYTASDITYYEDQAGLPHVTLQNVLIDGASGNPSLTGGEVEVSLDIEMAISMAPGLSKVIVYMAPNSTSYWDDLLNQMATDNLAKQLSCSWGVNRSYVNPVYDQIFLQMKAQGQSFFNASGDRDAFSGPVGFPADDPYITQVGGTTLTTSGPGGDWVSETVWNNGNGTGSGGGISTQYSIPDWQANVSMAINQGSTTMRNIPDVALTADNVYVRANGLNYSVYGTSCAAPLWAGFTALVNQQAAASGWPAVGFINPAVYAIGEGTNYTSCFHDITEGNNTSSSSPNKFYAVAGYDLCTGWGTPAGQNLINALVVGIVSSRGYIDLDRPYYSYDANIGIFVSDIDLAGNNTCDVTITTSGGDSEIVTLFAVNPGGPMFKGTIRTGSGTPEVNDGILQIADGQIITGTYYDADDGTGNPAEPNYTAIADCVNPVISDVNYTEQIIGQWQVITVNTNEPTGVRVILGMSCGASDIVVESVIPQLGHTLRFNGMEEGTYYFKIEVTDQAGNMVVDDNDGACYQFTRQDIHVPDNYNTIQEAIDASQQGDVIVVSEGTYYEAIDLKNKDIWVRSADPNDWNVVSDTVINGNGAKVTVKTETNYHNYDYPALQSRFSGFTVTGGSYGLSAKYFNKLVVENCIISGNSDRGIDCNDGGVFEIRNCSIYGNENGICCSTGMSIIDSSFIYNNTNYGVYCNGGTTTVTRSSIYDNGNAGVYCGGVIGSSSESITSSLIYSNAGGIVTDQNYLATIANCTIVNNSNFGVLNNSQRFVPKIYNCILWNNSDELYNCSATYSCIKDDNDAGTGNIYSDPCFGSDFRIDVHSLCVNRGDPNRSYTGQTDIDGEARVMGRCVDIGADEVNINAPEPNGHWWKLDEVNGVTAYDSVGTTNGTFNGNDPCWVTGLIGGAANFNGVSDYFSVSGLNSCTDYNNFDTFTVAGWFNTSKSSGMQTIIGQWGQLSPYTGYNIYSGWQVLVESNNVVARFGNGPPTPSDIAGSRIVTDGNWHCFALVYPTKNSNAVLYVDGYSDGTPGMKPFGLMTPCRIGDGSYVATGNPPLKGGPFCGMIDDVMIFNRALTADEVYQLYAVGR